MFLTFISLIFISIFLLLFHYFLINPIQYFVYIFISTFFLNSFILLITKIFYHLSHLQVISFIHFSLLLFVIESKLLLIFYSTISCMRHISVYLSNYRIYFKIYHEFFVFFLDIFYIFS
jgi:hypothetical protein